MSKYIKPTIVLAASGTASAAASTCSTSATDAKEIKDILLSMGYDLDKVFAPTDGCLEEVMIFEEYCKFSSAIQIFFS